MYCKMAVDFRGREFKVKYIYEEITRKRERERWGGRRVSGIFIKYFVSN